MCSHLWDVIRFRNIDTLKALLELGEDINFKDPNYCDGTLLHFAIERRWFDIADFLIHKGADVNAADRSQETPIHLAIKQNNLELTKRLVEHGAFLHSDYHWQPLHEAVYAQSLEIVQFLISAGAAINAVDNHGETAIDAALTYSSREIIDFLLSCGAAKSIHVAAAIGDVQAVEQFLKTGTCPNVRLGESAGASPLHVAAIHNQLEVAELLIQSGAEINLWCDQDTFTIVEACQHSSVEMVRLLLENGARTDVTNLGGGLLWNAAFGGRTDIAQLLISENNLPANEPSLYCPAFAAISGGHVETLKFLLSQGASIPEIAIFWAALDGHHDMVKFLAESNVDPNVRISTGETALDRVITLENAAMVETLISVGADINAKDKRGYTSLKWAAVMGNLEIAQLLVSAGADVNAGLECGDTAIRAAGLWRYDTIVELLIKHGAKG